MPPRIDYSGVVIGNRKLTTWTSPSNSKDYLWHYICLLCGTESSSPGRSADFKRFHTANCCRTHGKWTGFEEISGQHLSQMRTGARVRNLEWAVTPEFIWQLFLKQNRRCVYTGRILCLENPRTASLDRVDSHAGYLPNNVQWVHKDVNRAKMALTENEFLQLCLEISSGPKLRRE